ncbi:MAG TPA: alpha/beta fold hydrolase [Candidatus Paceibacterota bacterium]|jgi:proline iminopeptidase|nr:alpha/beta fold hydrolase [Candidatus Paceibacterota bacterium]
MKEHFLDEKDGHIVYFAEYGNPDGLPILGFHGGPGSKSRPAHAERYDLKKYRVILFDQRGCGKSTPLGKTENNTTEDLLQDAERIRESLGIETWFVSGGSWGSTLSLLYAIKYPNRVKGLLLSAIFLADHDSVKWSMEDIKGVARLMPDVWAKRMEFFKKFNIKLETQNADILKAFESASPEEQKEIAAGVQNWESNLFTPQSPISYKNPEEITDADIASTKLFTYYEMNHEFLPDNYVLEQVNVIAHIPAVIVHGRYDILCPLEKAQALKEKLNNCELVIATSSGHKLTSEGEAIQRMAYDRFLETYS